MLFPFSFAPANESGCAAEASLFNRESRKTPPAPPTALTSPRLHSLEPGSLPVRTQRISVSFLFGPAP